MKVVFVAGNFMPTAKAHGVHVAKQCEGFVAAGVETELWFPAPRPAMADAKSGAIFDFYDIAEDTFAVRPFTVPTVMRLEQPLGRVFPYVYAAYSQMVAVQAALIARRRRADLYFTTEIDIAFWMTMTGAPAMWECHRVPQRLGRYELKQVFQRESLRGVVPLTTITRDELVGLGLRADRALVTGEGVEVSVYDALPPSVDCRSRLGLPVDRPIVAYVGRFRTMGHEKGIPELVRAMARVPTVDGKEPLLVCVGGPMDCVPSYRREAADAGTPENRLQFVDHVPSGEVPYWIRAADVVVMPFPAQEHYARYMSPMKLFEYMAAKAPIVSTDLPAVRDVLHHDVNAWLVPPDDDDALAGGISKLLLDSALAGRLGAQARRDVEPHDWAMRARRLLAHANAGSLAD